MELTLAGIDPDTFDVEALGSGVARLAEIAPDPEPFRLVLAADFEAAVRERVADPYYAANYRQERLFGSATAKTLFQDDGSIDLILDARLLHGDARPRSSISTVCSRTRPTTSSLIGTARHSMTSASAEVCPASPTTATSSR
jgi:hypothetical protein